MNKVFIPIFPFGSTALMYIDSLKTDHKGAKFGYSCSMLHKYPVFPTREKAIAFFNSLSARSKYSLIGRDGLVELYYIKLAPEPLPWCSFLAAIAYVVGRFTPNVSIKL